MRDCGAGAISIKKPPGVGRLRVCRVAGALVNNDCGVHRVQYGTGAVTVGELVDVAATVEVAPYGMGVGVVYVHGEWGGDRGCGPRRG